MPLTTLILASIALALGLSGCEAPRPTAPGRRDVEGFSLSFLDAVCCREERPVLAADLVRLRGARPCAPGPVADPSLHRRGRAALPR